MLNPRTFLSVSLNLAIQSCQIIKDSHVQKNIKHYSKGHNNPVTQIDYKIQSTLIKAYKHHFPTLKIIGEEQKQYEGSINVNMGFEEMSERVRFGREYEMEKCCLWIDPIDNTRGFIEGQIQAVTTLIGVSYGSQAEIGVIAIPFKRNKQRVYYHPSVIFGCVSSKIAYEYYPKQNRWVSLFTDRNRSLQFTRLKKKIVVSPFRQNILQKKIAQKLNCEIVQGGGSGYKMAMVAKGQADMMAYCLSHTQKWDTCAGQAIIKALQGECVNRLGQSIRYDRDNPQEHNQDGVLCSLDTGLLERSIEICKDKNNL